MHRALMLLALAMAGIAAVGTPGTASWSRPSVIGSAADRVPADFGIAAAHAVDPSPFLAAPSAPLPILPSDGTRAGSRPPSVRAGRSADRPGRASPLAAMRATSASCGADFRRDSAPLALARSGLLTSSPTTAPPSFRFA